MRKKRYVVRLQVDSNPLIWVGRVVVGEGFRGEYQHGGLALGKGLLNKFKRIDGVLENPDGIDSFAGRRLG